LTNLLIRLALAPCLWLKRVALAPSAATDDPQTGFYTPGGAQWADRGNWQLGVADGLSTRPDNGQQQGLGLDMISVQTCRRASYQQDVSRFGPFGIWIESGLPAKMLSWKIN